LIETRTEYMDKERRRVREEAAKAAAATVSAGAAGKTVPASARPDQTALADAEHGASVDAPDGKTGATTGDPNLDAAKTAEREHSIDASPALYFEDHEETFIQLLHAFIDRPRLAKRFINIYRLLRVRADDEGESALFAGSSSSREYRAASILLAIHVGHPTIAARVIDALDRAPDDGSWPDLLEALAGGRVAGVVCSEREKREIDAVASTLRRIGDRMPAELEAYRRWAPRVACYSFDWHRAEPGGPPRGRGTNPPPS